VALEDYLGGIEWSDPAYQQRLIDMANPQASMPVLPENSTQGGVAPPPPMEPMGPPRPMIGPPVPVENYGPPTTEELQKYGATPEAAAAAHRYNAPGPMPAQSATNPTKADPAWNPDVEQQKTAAWAREKALASVTPEAPPVDPDSGGAGVVSSPGRFVKGQWVPSSRSRSTDEGFDPAAFGEGQRQRAVADNYGSWANDDIRKAAATEAAGEVAYAAAKSDALRLEAERQERIEAQKQAYVIREHEKLDDLNQAAQAQVDPELAKGSMGSQILAAFAVGLGQFGASLSGGTNTALQIVNANIDRRIAAQQANINNAHKSLNNEESLYKANLAAFGDRERASLATKMQYLDQAKSVLDSQYASAKSNRNDAQHHTMSQALADRRAEVADNFSKLTTPHSTTQGVEHYAPGHMEGGGQAVGTKGQSDLFVPELGVYARTKEEAKEMRANSVRTQNTVRELKNAQAIIDEAKTTYSPARLRVLQAKMDGIAARAKVTATVKEGQGAMSAGDAAVSEAGLGLAGINLGLINKANPGTLSLDDSKELIGTALTAHQQEYGRMGSGQQRGKEVYVRNAQGNMEARQVLSGSNAAARNKVDNTSDLIQAPVGKSARKK